MPSIKGNLIPSKYSFLTRENLPKHVKFALEYYGMREIVGDKHNETILRMADTLNPAVGNFFTNDEYAWCAVFAGYVLKSCDFPIPAGYDAMRAKAYAKIGEKQTTAMFGDILVLERTGGGHVCFYIAEDDKNYHVLGGNQKNMVCIVPVEKSRVTAIRRVNGGGTVRKVYVDGSEKPSNKED